MENFFKEAEKLSTRYTVYSLDGDSLAQLISRYIKENFPNVLLKNASISPPEDLNEADDPRLSLDFESATETDLERYYDASAFVDLLSEMLCRDVYFCTIRDGGGIWYVDLYFDY